MSEEREVSKHLEAVTGTGRISLEATIDSRSDQESDETLDDVDVNIQNDKETDAEVDSSQLEQSFEVIPHPPTLDDSSKMESSDETSKNIDDVDQRQEDNGPGKSQSVSESRDISVQSRVKKSGSFLSKLHSSNDENEGTNIQSSIASAFSSFSSFTSNFTLNSTTTNGNQSANNLTIETASVSTKMSQISETREEIFLKKAATERKNLTNLTKLIVKDLISSSLKAGRTIDDCQNAIHLNNYFTLVDRVLKHGLKQNLLSSKSASLWTALDSLPKYLKEATLMSESVRSLANTKSADGKIKAWVRLAMMQKKLPEYFNELLANKNVLLKDIYHDYAFMLNDEASVFAGLIIGINVIDCNFFVKDANFDSIDDIIDLGPYLRAANSYDEDHADEPAAESNNESPANLKSMKVVLDQKNYLEEWNKRLESTITNLQLKIKNLEEQNSKLEMEAKVSEVRIQKLQEKRGDIASEKSISGPSPITGVLKNLIAHNSFLEPTAKQTGEPQITTTEPSGANSTSPEPIDKGGDSSATNEAIDSVESVDKSKDEATLGSLDTQHDSREAQIPLKIPQPEKGEALEKPTNPEEVEQQKKLIGQLESELASLRERAGILETSYRVSLEKIKVIERDLDVQTSMNADKETTIKMYEKDIRDKQTQVESLRVSLSDAKKLNADLNERLNDISAKLKDRVKSVSNLQASLDKWKLENKTLASRLQEKQASLEAVKKELGKATKNMDELKKYNEKVNDDLRRERESGQSSSVTVETQNSRIAELNEKLSRFESELENVRPYRDRSDELERRCRDYEQSLEEIGAQLRESRLEVENLKENSAVFLDSQWMDSKQVKSCTLCEQTFSVTRRKHHCRLCGNVFCQTCSDNKMELASSAKPVRVCDTCHAFLLAKFVKHSAAT